LAEPWGGHSIGIFNPAGACNAPPDEKHPPQAGSAAAQPDILPPVMAGPSADRPVPYQPRHVPFAMVCALRFFRPLDDAVAHDDPGPRCFGDPGYASF